VTAAKGGEGQRQSLRSRAASSFSWSVIAKLTSQGATFIGTILLARILPVADFGLIAMAQVYLGFLQQFIDAGFLEALIQRPSLTQKELSGAFWLLLGAGFAGFLGSLLARSLLESIFGTPGIGWVIVVLSSVLMFLPFRIISQAVLSRDVRIQDLSKREAVVNVLRLAASVWMARAGAGVWSLVFPQIVAEMVFSLWCYRRAGWRLTAEFSWPTLRPLVRFGFDMTLSRLVWFSATRADQFIIGRVLGPTALGLYSIAWQFAGALPQFASATLLRVVFPVFARLQHDSERLRRGFLEVTRAAAHAVLPALAGLALVAPDLFALLLKPSWGAAVVPLQMLCPLAFLKIVDSLAGFLINARAGTRRNLVFNLLSLVATVGGVTLGTMLGGLTAVSILVTLSCIPVTLLFVRAAMHECGGTLGQWAAAIRGPLGATLLMAAVVAMLGALLPGDGHVVRATSMVATGAAVYLLVTIPATRELVAQFRGRRQAQAASPPE
jgi:O-antigen/teichoic acid export membrane protein